MKAKGFATLAVLVTISAIAFVLLGVEGLVVIGQKQHELTVARPTVSTRVCTQEAKQCPDGSYVSRTGLACEFAPCPSTSGIKVLSPKGGEQWEIGKEYIVSWSGVTDGGVELWLVPQLGSDKATEVGNISGAVETYQYPLKLLPGTLPGNYRIKLRTFNLLPCAPPLAGVEPSCGPVYGDEATSELFFVVPPLARVPVVDMQACCTAAQQKLGYQCIEDCGPPVVSTGDSYKATYSCLSPKDVEIRGVSSCPVCLSSNTKIATPSGGVNVRALKAGMLVWTLDRAGRKVVQPLITVSSMLVPANHHVVHLVLKDGRELWVSPNHPTVSGLLVGTLEVGDGYDGSVVTGAALVAYTDTRTYDLLPAGDTGFYWANGILMASTLFTPK